MAHISGTVVAQIMVQLVERFLNVLIAATIDKTVSGSENYWRGDKQDPSITSR